MGVLEYAGMPPAGWALPLRSWLASKGRSMVRTYCCEELTLLELVERTISK
jgi:hypothetical protein